MSAPLPAADFSVLRVVNRFRSSVKLLRVSTLLSLRNVLSYSKVGHTQILFRRAGIKSIWILVPTFSASIDGLTFTASERE